MWPRWMIAQELSLAVALEPSDSGLPMQR